MSSRLKSWVQPSSSPLGWSFDSRGGEKVLCYKVQMRAFRLGLAFLTVIVGIFGATAGQSLPPRPCDLAAVPPEIRTELKNKFAGWRPKQLSDLDEDAQRFWRDGLNRKNCPGIAIGHFESAEQNSFDFLLVPESETNKGYKIVVFSRGSNENPYASQLLDSADGETYSGLVILKAKPGTFSDVEGTKKIQTKLDGVIVEWIGKGSILYYWSDGRYQQLTISD
jgi:hypothetical protein